MKDRNAYLTGVLDQLETAISRKDGKAASRILADVQQRSPADADVILNRLIAAGLQRAAGG